MAQLAEQLICNQQVIGSSPIIGLKGADCKSVGNAFEGSNPSPSTYADVAQLAEQLICNQQVIGSSPIIGLKFIISRDGAVWKLVGLITRRS